ncbi:hypothetical protein KBZ21_36565, partial [Streptomyces sp. A73]|nr:hypothetical protein [Streptomyces sp. A73]
AAKTEDGVLEKKYGTSRLVTLQRTTDDRTVATDDPHWTGTIHGPATPLRGPAKPPVRRGHAPAGQLELTA